MKTYTYKSKLHGFQMAIPDDWLDSPMLDELLGGFSKSKGYQENPSGKKTNSITIIGPSGKYLNILVTPLLENEPEPSINDTWQFFDGWSNRQNLNVIKTGTICIANKEHFWATYYRGFILSLAAGGQMQLNRVEYLFTAGLYSFSAGEKPPTDHDLSESEKVFDEMVSSIRLVNF